MIFTRHAAERYLQFHMLDVAGATIDDAYARLMSHASDARKVGARTVRGDPVWLIESLGVELVAKHEDGRDICVTVLPPVRFRGLSPLQAEAIASRAEELKSEMVTIAAEQSAIEIRSREVKSAAGQVFRSEQGQLKARYLNANVERDILCALFKTMRQQMATDEDKVNLKRALKVALRFISGLHSSEAVEVIAEISEIDPGLVSLAFLEAE